MQPHLAWEWTFLPRLEIMKPRTGFISFGPYRTQQCGHDDQGNDFPRMKYIYESFRDKECPMDRPQLVSGRVRTRGNADRLQSLPGQANSQSAERESWKTS